VDCQDSVAFLNDVQASSGKVLLPETLMRPDGVLMLQHDNGTRCCMTFGICLYTGGVPNTKIDEQHISTDLQKVYHIAKGNKVNKNAQVQYDAWAASPLGQVDAIPTIRVNVALPCAESANPPELLVTGNDVSVWLDRSNCHLMLPCDDRLKNLLAYATSTSSSSWWTSPH
jgi:hypothetical protein